MTLAVTLQAVPAAVAFDPLEHGLGAGSQGQGGKGSYDPLAHGLSAERGLDTGAGGGHAEDDISLELLGQILNMFGVRTLAQKADDARRNHAAAVRMVDQGQNPFEDPEMDAALRESLTEIQYDNLRREVNSPDFATRQKMREFMRKVREGALHEVDDQ